jgi:hypothetical protein
MLFWLRMERKLGAEVVLRPVEPAEVAVEKPWVELPDWARTRSA